MIYLHGIGHFHPENVITNQFLEELDIGTTVDWIMERVGIETRRTILPLDYIRKTKNADPGQHPRSGSIRMPRWLLRQPIWPSSVQDSGPGTSAL